MARPGPTFRPCLGANRGGQRAHREVHKTVRHEHAHDTLVIQIAAQLHRSHLKALLLSRGVAHTKQTASNRQQAAAPASTATATVTGATANMAMFRQAIHLPPWKHCTPSPGRQQLGRQRRSLQSMLALHPCASQQFLAVWCRACIFKAVHCATSAWAT